MKTGDFILIFFSFVGVVLSGILIEHHISPATDSSFVQAVCDIGGKSGCDAVNQSDASSLLGMPLAFWGFLYYAIVFAFSSLYVKYRQTSLIRIVFYLTLIAILVDVTLLLYSLIVVETVCNLCILTYLATLGVFLGTWFVFKSKKEPVFKLGLDLSWLSGQPVALTLIVVSLISVVFVDSFVYLYAKSSSKTTTQGHDTLLEEAWESFKRKYESLPTKDLPIAHSPYKGAQDPVLTIVEFADFLCPHCKQVSLRLKDIVEKYGKSIKVIFKHYPLDQECNKNITSKLHDGSCKIAYLGHCVTQQRVEAFWKVHDDVFARLKEWSRKGRALEKDFNAIVRKSGVNMGAVSSCIPKESTKKTIVSDIELGDSLGVTSTPAIFINGKRVRRLPNDYFFEKLLTYEVQKQLGGN